MKLNPNQTTNPLSFAHLLTRVCCCCGCNLIHFALFCFSNSDTLDPALLRPGRLDRKIEFSLPDLDGRTKILAIHCKSLNCDSNIRWELIGRLCPNTTGAELRSVCTEAGMFAIRARRKLVTEADMLEAVQKVIKGYAKFSSTPKYMTYN